MTRDARLVERLVRAACRIEVCSHKPGNVAPGAEFADATVKDFLKSADVAAPILANGHGSSVGESIFEAVRQTRAAVGHNTNLGIVLLLAPLCRVPLSESLVDGLPKVLNSLTVEDSKWAYRAITLANPGGLGAAAQQNVRDEPTQDLQSCMCLAADRDLIARQYCNGFQEVLAFKADWTGETHEFEFDYSQRVSLLALRLMARFGDSLIARKCGEQLSMTVRDLAREVMDAGWPSSNEGIELFRRFDEFLRADGNRRNPGTTADMVAAIVFAGMRDGGFSESGPSMPVNGTRSEMHRCDP